MRLTTQAHSSDQMQVEVFEEVRVFGPQSGAGNEVTGWRVPIQLQAARILK